MNEKNSQVAMLIIYVIGGAVNDALLRSKKSMSVTIGAWVICFMYPRKLQHTPLEHTPGNPPTQLWKDSLYNLLVKV